MKKKNMEAVRIIFLIACVGYIAFMLFKIFSGPKKDPVNNTEDAAVNHGGDEKQGKEELQNTLNSVNSWLNNCDQKAGTLLAVMGVAFTVIMTGDFMKFIRNQIFHPFMEYCEGQSELVFSWNRFTVFFLLVTAAVLLIMACLYLFRAITANIDYDKMRKENPGLVRRSYIYFGSISKMTYEEFERNDEDYASDLKSQIYVNSKIAIEKFENYNTGLLLSKLLLWVSVMLFVAVLFM